MEMQVRTPPTGPYIDWLVRHALPRWSTTGVDRQGGGFFEKIGPRGQPIEEPRRARVVTRQIYVFATAARQGWHADADALVDHGLSFLLERMRLADGTFAAAVLPDGAVVRSAFDLYEHAFVLFALAAACQRRQQAPAGGAAPDAMALRRIAEDLLVRMRDRWGHPRAGFEEAEPRTLPLKSNPHMHLLEAALAWCEIGDDSEDGPWETLAGELVSLCLEHFIQPDSGAVHEYFDGDWRALVATAGGCHAIEPGHQFEWAWLLLRWSARTGDARARSAARRLLVVGEQWGVDARRDVALNALHADLVVADHGARLWPQTERVKAWHLAADQFGSAAQAAQALRHRDAALRSLMRFPMSAPCGLWHEQMNLHGSFDLLPCRASSLYHLVCAADAVARPAQAAAPAFAAPRQGAAEVL